jgi:type I restriction enzyme S subunit
MRLPALRFKDDDGKDFPEWKEKLVGEVFNDFKGTGLSKDKIGEVGKNKCILYGHLFTKYSEVITDIESRTDFIEGLASEAGDILMPSSTTTKGIDLAKASSLNQSGVLLGGDIIVLRLKEKGNSNFFAYFLTHAKSKDIAEITQGITIIHLYFSQLKNILLNYPCDKEQTKIANFLTAVDEKISHLTQKHDLLTQYKKGVMQQIFSQELRFKDDGGKDFPEWEEKELRTICDLITKGTTPTSVGHEFKISGINFIKIESLEADGKLIKEKLGFIDSNAHAKLMRSQLKLNDLLFSIAGALGRVAIVTDEFLPANTNQALAIIRLNKSIAVDTKFVFYALTNEEIKKLIESISVQLAQANLSLKDIGDFVIQFPCLKEQTKIATFLTAIDDKITNTQTQLQAVKQYKQGLLQQMFV